MASIQGESTNQEYSIIPEYSPGITFFRNTLSWDAGTNRGDFIPPDESGIQVIYDFTVHNITPPTGFVNQPWETRKLYDPLLDKEKLTIIGAANQIWLITMIGAPRQ